MSLIDWIILAFGGLVGACVLGAVTLVRSFIRWRSLMIDKSSPRVRTRLAT